MSEWPVTLLRNFVPEPAEEASAPDRLPLSSSDLYPILLGFSDTLNEFRQERPRAESDFIGWARKLKVQAWSGYPEGDVTLLWKRGWIRSDEAVVKHRSPRRWAESPAPVEELGRPLALPFKPAGRWHRYELHCHPFRLFPFMKILDAMNWHLTRTSILYPHSVIQYAKGHTDWFKGFSSSESFLSLLNWWNGIADLAILLEPIYWPKITGWRVRNAFHAQSDEEERALGERFEAYRASILKIARRIPKARVAQAHINLRHEAALLDGNHELYLVLRAASWRKRERVEGHLGCAMWLRHIAEVLRHGFDELYDDRLVHEDEAFGMWYEGARKWVYGSEYPLDNIAEMTRRVLPRWGIASSPRVRFYVEGETEEGALEAGLEGILGFGAEVVNLRAQGWGTWLRQELENDVAAKRLSLFMLDDDQVKDLPESEARKRQDAIRALKAHARENLIVGMTFINSPDLELGCFTISELLKATEYWEQDAGFTDLEPLDPAAFESVRTGREFEERYCQVRLAPSLKGKSWGAALMRVAFESDYKESNRLVDAWACAARGVTTDYEVQRTRAPIDPETLRSISVRAGGLP